MSEEPLRLAVYGFVEKEAGGLASANFLVLERLLLCGHWIDFYAIDPWVRPADLFAFPRFRYCGFQVAQLEWGWKVVNLIPGRRLRAVVQVGYSQMTSAGYMRVIGAALRHAHRERPYDALLTLGLLSPFRAPELTTVSWTQGTPNGEREALVNQKRRLIPLCGRPLYAGLMAFYRWREFATRRQLRLSQFVIAGSRWALGSWERLGHPPSRGFALPYPVDLQRYTPPRRERAAGQPVVLLHLGRLVPRKRLDLLLEAFQLLCRDQPEVRLRIIGAFAYAHGYQALLRDPQLTAGVEYQTALPRAEAQEALRKADILVQPSENENFGTAVAEAQACGLPVVLGPTNGTRDYLGTKEFCFPAYEPKAVAEAMARAVAAVLSRKDEVTAVARAAAERHYDIVGIVDQLTAILRRAADHADAVAKDGTVPAGAAGF